MATQRSVAVFGARRGMMGIAWLVLTMVFLALAVPTVHGQEYIPIRMANLAFPSLASIMTSIIPAKGFDKANGLELKVENYSAVSAYYAALAVGEVDTLFGGPHVLQRMRNQGVPITGTTTGVRLSAVVVITPDPDIQTLNDLKGKTLAADMGSSEYQILRIVARAEGVDLGEEVTVIQASPALARTHLRAGNADAIMTWEPSATLTLTDDPNYRTIFNGEEGWRQISQVNGWDLITLTREDWLRRHPEAFDRWVRTLQDAARFIRESPEEADKIVAEGVGLPEGIFLRAVREGRIDYDIRPAYEDEAALQEMFRAGVYSGFVNRLPDAGAIYRPDPN